MQLEGCAFDDYKKLPTFAQWLKVASDADVRPRRFVEKIWLPNTFPNFTLETEVFRLRVVETSAIGTTLSQLMEELADEESAVYVEVIDKAKGLYRIGVADDEKASWETLGESGFKLTIQDKPNKKRAPKNSSSKTNVQTPLFKPHEDPSKPS